MRFIHEIKAARAAVKVHYNSADSEYLVRLYHLTEKAASSGRGAGVMVENYPARYYTNSKEDAIATAKDMIARAYTTAPALPVKYDKLRDVIIDQVEQQYLNRNESGAMESGADFVSGAMSAMLAMGQQLYKLDPDNGAIMPPRWVFGCMRGDLTESIKEAQKPAKERA